MEGIPILVHIGYHKTATTWLQNCIFNSSDIGFVSPWGPQAGIAVNTFVVQNPFYFDPESARAALWTGIQNAQRRSLLPVLSNEAMCGTAEPRKRYERDVADRLYQALPNAKVLITIRNQNEAILSHYREAVAAGATYSIDQYLESPSKSSGFAAPCQIDHFEYDVITNYYMSLFGKMSVLVLPQEKLRSEPQKYLDALLDFVELNRSVVPASKDMRVGSSGTALQFRRFCNILNIGVRKPGIGNRIGPRLVGRFGRLAERSVPTSLNWKIEEHMRNVVTSHVGGYFADSNKRLQSLTGLDLARWGYCLPK